MEVEYLDHMGTDLCIVNAARVSMGKFKHEFDDADDRLLAYLVRENHWSPAAHVVVKLRVKCTIPVARQLYKHKIGGSENEVSRRYVVTTPELEIPVRWRMKAPNVKQGSSDTLAPIGPEMQAHIERTVNAAVTLYDDLLLLGVCPEQARVVLPQCVVTEFIWTGSLAFWARVCRLRLDPHAQAETREVAEAIAEICGRLFPAYWSKAMA